MSGAGELPRIDMPLTREDRRRKYRGKRALGIYAAVAALIVAAVGIPLWVFAPPAPCQSGLVAVQDGSAADCIGLTDGSQLFDPVLAGVEALILKENDRVARSGKAWAGVAYLNPMTLGSASSLTREGVLHQLQGMYTAQWEANHGSALGDTPLIKLYLANDGLDGSQWNAAATAVITATTNGLKVVAVAGMGNSSANARSAARALSKARLAMFGATITADDFNGSVFPGLVRVAPTNTDEVKAAIRYLSQTPSKGRTALLVQDADTADDYVRTWSTELAALYPTDGRQFVSQPESFDRTLNAIGDRFVQISRVICTEKPHVVFFAGRARQLEQFVGALGANCGAPVTVISGDDASVDADTSTAQDYADYQRALASGNVSLFSTALANPHEWNGCGSVPASQASASRSFALFRQDYAIALGGQASPLDDGSAMMARDAMVAAIQTIREPVQQSSGQPGSSYQEVTQNLSGLHDTPIAGASGVITISNYGQANGDPVGKPLAIVKHQPNGPVTCEQLVVP
jgi:hypothetical protein